MNAVPTKGIDVWQGKVTLILGALIVIAILALRFVRPERRNAMAIAITVAGTRRARRSGSGHSSR